MVATNETDIDLEELEDTKEDFKTQRLINMEMKDYERSVNELKKTVESAQEEAESYKKGKNIRSWMKIF